MKNRPFRFILSAALFLSAFACLSAQTKLDAAAVGRIGSVMTDALTLREQAAAAVAKLPDASAPEKARCLRRLASIRADYLNVLARAKADIEAAIALQPDDTVPLNHSVILNDCACQHHRAGAVGETSLSTRTS